MTNEEIVNIFKPLFITETDSYQVELPSRTLYEIQELTRQDERERIAERAICEIEKMKTEKRGDTEIAKLNEIIKSLRI